MNIMLGHNNKGEHIVLMILEPGNLERLKQGQPILKRIQDFFPDGVPKKLEIVIHYSETPVGDFKELANMSEMSFDERTPVSKKMKPHCPECKTTIEQMGVWRNESIMAIVFCPQCGCVFGMVPSEVVKELG